MKKIRKALAGFTTAVITGAGTLVSLGLLSGDARNEVIGIIAAATPLLVFLGIYKAKPNEPTI